MTRKEYQAILQPAIDKVVDLLIANEPKYGEGIKLDSQDIIKAASHSISSYRGQVNPDGETHAVAAASRALKAVLGEVQ